MAYVDMTGESFAAHAGKGKAVLARNVDLFEKEFLVATLTGKKCFFPSSTTVTEHLSTTISLKVLLFNSYVHFRFRHSACTGGRAKASPGSLQG